MFPNPQDALPLPSRPRIEQYRKLAKDLAKACKSGDDAAIGTWADGWIAALARATGPDQRPRSRLEMDRAAGQVEEFAARKLKASGPSPCGLADAQFIIARSHGFVSWPKFVEHLDRLAHGGSDATDFEAAADAIASGDTETLARLLRARPGLARVRSSREHRATLLHYVSANGVENYRQRTPENIVAVARILLDSGAEVDAEADVYGGGATALGLVATSAHPRIAGVQIPLLQLLLDRGAQMERRGIAGRDHGIALACLANGCPEAAVYLAERGARLGIVEAAGIGRLDVVKTFFDAQGNPAQGLAADVLHTAFGYACFYGRNEVAEFLIDRGVDLAGHSGDGQTGLHHAAMGGRLDTVKLLLRHRAPLEAVNEYDGTVLGQAVWSAAHAGKPDAYLPVIEALLAAGAKVRERHPPVSAEIDALLARYGSAADDSLRWFGQKPRTRKA